MWHGWQKKNSQAICFTYLDMVNIVKITLGTNNIKYPNKIQLWLVLTADIVVTVTAADDVAEFVLRLDIAAILSPAEKKRRKGRREVSYKVVKRKILIVSMVIIGEWYRNSFKMERQKGFSCFVFHLFISFVSRTGKAFDHAMTFLKKIRNLRQ